VIAPFSTTLRVVRAYTGQVVTANTMMMFRSVGPSNATIESASRMNGKASCRSTQRMTTASSQPR
jgi:hypothetical protein